MDPARALDQTTGREKMSIQLSDAIDMGLATLGCNERPEGWRDADFGDLLAYVAPECPDILGEVPPDTIAVEYDAQTLIAAGLVVDKNRSWDFRPFGQSPAVRKHRIERSYLRSNAWKIACGVLSRKEAKKSAKKYAERAVAYYPTAGCKCAVRMGSRTWLTVL